MIDNKPPKPKTPQKQNLTEVDGRDAFQTPNYAVNLLMPFLIKAEYAWNIDRIWECAAGLGKISKYLEQCEYEVLSTDLSYEGGNKMNFLTTTMSFPFDAIVTNPPFSLKVKFYKKCLEYHKPFALLVPADYSGWTIESVEKDGCEKIIPTRRIDYITPNILHRIHEGEIWENSKEFYPDFLGGLKEFKLIRPQDWTKELETYGGYCDWKSIYDAPAKLLRKYSSSYCHSMWLTWGFGIGRTETFVELSNEDKFNI